MASNGEDRARKTKLIAEESYFNVLTSVVGGQL